MTRVSSWKQQILLRLRSVDGVAAKRRPRKVRFPASRQGHEMFGIPLCESISVYLDGSRDLARFSRNFQLFSTSFWLCAIRESAMVGFIIFNAR